jgi:hypothetical protein
VAIDDIADTNDATPAVSGSGEPGSTIVLTDSNGNTVGSVIVQGDGSWTAELDSLPEGNNTITATATDPYGNSADAVTPPFIVDTTASTPVVTVSDAVGNEDTAIPLNISSALTDTDGSESLSDITISGIPVGAVLSAGTDNGDGSWTLTQEQLTGLTITPPENSDDDFTLTVSATSTESNGDTATATENIDVTVNAVADAPTVTLNVTGQNVVNDGLVGHWVFDENDTAGGRTYNLVDDREGILTGDAQFNSEGHTNSSMVLDGNGDYVDVVGDYNTPLAGTATLSAWIKLPDGFTGVAGNKDIGWDSPSIIGSEQNGGINDIQWGWISDDGHINMGVGNSYGAESTTKVNDGAWHHVVLTRDHVTGETKVYVDGVLEDTAVTVTGIKNSTPISGFGATFGSNGANEYLQGELDDIRIYDRVLTDYEISQISTYENNQNDYDLVGLEGDPIPFTVDAGLVDTDGSELITSIIISDIPEGATLTDGSNVFTATGANNAMDVLSWDKNNLSITADANNGGEGQAYALTISATSTESSNKDSATTSAPLKIFVIDTAPVALDDHDSVGFGGKASGNLILGIGGEDMEADELGHDTTTVSSITFGDTAYFFNSNGNLVDGAGQPIADNTIRADHGTLQINNDGSYSYISRESPSNVTHLDTFSYTLVDADGDTSTAEFSVSHDSLTTVSDSAMVYEAGLASGTAAASDLEVIAGNLLDNDLGVGETARITQIASDGNTDNSATDGILTVGTAYGTIKVHTADTTEHRAGDYEYTLTSATAGDNVIDTISYTVNNSHGGSSVSSLDISIVDDAPIGSNITNNIVDIDNSSQTTNLIIVLDRSGSMAWDLEGNSSNSAKFNTESVRMDIAKEALSSMFDSFDNLGNVNIQFVPFSSNASKSQWFIDDKNGANDYLHDITPNGSTYFDMALEKTVEDYDPPSADNTLVYFLSDGEPTNGHKIDAVGKSDWESFLETNKVDIAFGIGITDNVNLNSLKPIAYPNTNGAGDLDPYAIQVVNAFDLQQTLLETVSEGIVRGDVFFTESVDGGIVIGADGGHIQSIMVDGVLHEYDPVTKQTESVTTNRGGTISINYETGEYYYIINPKNTVSGEQETFVVTAVDNDGDTKSVDLVINLDYLATLDANSDRIITNTADGDSLSVAYDTLLANDTGSSQTTVDNIAPGAGTALTTSPDGLTFTDLADGENFTYQISAEGVTDSARVEVVRVDTAQLHGTSGDDILINSKPTARDYSIEAIVKPGNTQNQTNQIGIVFAGTADLYITDITIDLRDGRDSDAYFNIKGNNSSGPDIGSETTFTTSEQIFSATEDTPTLDLHFSETTFSPQNAFWFGADTNRLGANEGVDFGERGVGITVTLNDGTTLSGTYTAQSDGSSSVTLSDAAPALYGEEGDDYLQGSSADEIFDGGEGRDIIDAGDGDDTIVFDRADVHIDGGNGLDTLLIADEVLDFSVLRDGAILNIEKIDLNGSTDQRVSLTLDDVLDMTGVENVLEVRGEAGDTVAVDVTGWTQDENNSGLFSKGGDTVSIVSSADSDNAIHIDYTDDGTEVG